MPSCVFRKCINTAKKVLKDQGISYHRFPANEVILQDWIRVVRIQRCEHDWLPSNGSRVCTKHFKNEDKYISKKGLTLLKNNAIPIVEGHTEVEHHTPSTSSLDNVPLPATDKIIETPKKAALRKTVQQLSLDRQVLKKKNKLLSQQNKHLRKKITKTTTILKIIKWRNLISEEVFTQLNLEAETMNLFWQKRVWK